MSDVNTAAASHTSRAAPLFRPVPPRPTTRRTRSLLLLTGSLLLVATATAVLASRDSALGMAPAGATKLRTNSFRLMKGTMQSAPQRLLVQTDSKVKVCVHPLNVVPEPWGLVPSNQNGSITAQVLPRLRNRYLALRHGESEANLAGIISSDYEMGTTQHGLTLMGVTQARRAATALIEKVGRENIDNLMFVSSNFTRARQTAHQTIGALERLLIYEQSHLEQRGPKKGHELNVKIDDRLSERGFGDLDTTKVTNYNYVWPLDLYDARHTAFGVESVDNVVHRVRSLILEYEARYHDKTIVLASHADVLQILQCYVAEVDPRLFSQYRFDNAEVRELVQIPQSLPLPAPLCKIAPASALIADSILPQRRQRVDRNIRTGDQITLYDHDRAMYQRHQGFMPVEEEELDMPYGLTETLTQLSKLHASGQLSDTEFAEAKRRVLADYGAMNSL